MNAHLLPFKDVLSPDILVRVENTWEAAELSGPIGENVQAHMMRVAAAAWVIADRLRLPPVNCQQTAAAALLHDVSKLRQITVVEGSPVNFMEEIGRVAHWQEDFLLAQGWAWHIIEAASAAGHEILTVFLGQPGTINDLRKIIFYADLTVSNGGFTTVAKRLLAARQRYARIHSEGRDFYRLDAGVYAVLYRIARSVEDSFALRISTTAKEFHAETVRRAEAFLAK